MDLLVFGEYCEKEQTNDAQIKPNGKCDRLEHLLY